MKIPKKLLANCAAFMAAVSSVQALPVITSVVETGGVNEATDTITAKMTGETFSNGIATEFPNPTLVPTFGEEAYAYVDRLHQWNGATAALPLPAYLVGGEYIMIGNDNRDRAGFRLDITVSEQVIVYLLIDNRLSDGNNANPPFNGLPFQDWTLMTWLQTNTFAPVLNGLNRTADPNIPDEVGVDGDGNGTGPGGSIQDFHSVYSAVFPAGTFSLYQADNATRNMYGVVVKRLPGSVNAPPEISNLSPTNNTFSASAASGLNFKVTTAAGNSIAPANIRLLLNGTQVTGLNVTGTAADRTVAYTNLAPNIVYNATIIAADQAGRAVTNQFSFDTFTSAAVVIEAEDYNFGGGQVVSPLTPGAFTNMQATVGIDYFDLNPANLSVNYRTNDFVGLGVSADAARTTFTSALATDFVVNNVQAGEWLNYTRNIPAGNYNIYLRGSASSAQRVQLDKVTGATTTNQTTTPLGVFDLNSNTYGYAPLTDIGGRPVTVALGGDTTLRLTSLDALVNLNLNFLALVPTTNAPSAAYVATISPIGTGISSASDITARVQNGSTTATAATLLVNGTDVTSQAVTTPNASGFVGVYNPTVDFAAGSTNNVTLILADNTGARTTNNFSFTVANFITLPTNINTAIGTGVGDGFVVHTHKINNSVTTLANTFARAEAQLADQLIDPNSGAPYFNEAAMPDGITTNRVINFHQGIYDLNLSIDRPLPTGYIAGDELFPNIFPSFTLEGNPNNIALAATAYLELQPGIYRFGVRSDDGFRLTFGPTFTSSTIVAGGVEGGRGDGLPGGATEFDVKVTEAGLYPVRLLYYEGTGGASLEFYTVDPVTQLRTLVNDRTIPNAVKAYVARTTELFVPTVTLLTPTNTATYATYPTNVQLSVEASVTNGTITKVEYFAGTNKIAESTSAPFSVNWTTTEPGKLQITARVTDNQGFTATTPATTITVGTPTIMINFQNAAATTPEGNLPDIGEVFGDRGNGYSYGWDTNNTVHARDRNNANSPNERYDTFTHLQKTDPLPAGRVWEIELPNGRYKVAGASGDPSATDSVFDVRAEGLPLISGVPVTGAWFVDGAAIIDVNDGRLTITNGPLASNNKINFLDIYAMGDLGPKLTIGRVGTNIQITWTGGGALQSNTDLNATNNWTNVGATAGTHTEPIGTGNKFFRVLR